jgi:asparagine synthase (glutamine-hydrolysing)
MPLLAAVFRRRQEIRHNAAVRAMLEWSPAFSGERARVAAVGEAALGCRGPIQSGPSSTAIWSDGEIAVVLDGRMDWARSLSVPRPDAETCAGSELVGRAYRRYGSSFVERLFGDFALILWDSRVGAIMAARDTFGVRPLYYADTPEALAVASDPEQLLGLTFVPRKLDPDAVIDYLVWDAASSDRSFFQAIRAVPGAHRLTANLSGTSVTRYRSPALRTTEQGSRDAYYEYFRVALEDSVRRSISADGSVVAELSGGLDSSSVVCLADSLVRSGRAARSNVVVVSARYPGLPTDEGEFIQAVVERISFPSRSWDATTGTVNELEDDRSLALPGGRFATFAGTEGQLDIMKDVGTHVLISGLGGDQVGGSTGSLRDAVTEGRWGDAARIMLAPSTSRPFTRTAILRALLRSFAPEPLKRIRSAGWAPPFWLSHWARARNRPPRAPARLPEIRSEVGRRKWQSLSSGLHAMTMTYVNHYAVRNGIEFRFPFLDLDVVASALSIPSQFWPPPWPFERLHRQALADILPPKVYVRKSKANFDPAFRVRVARHLPSIHELLTGLTWASAQFVDQKDARRLFDLFQRPEPPSLSTIYGLWAVATLESWMRRISRYAPPPERGDG